MRGLLIPIVILLLIVGALAAGYFTQGQKLFRFDLSKTQERLFQKTTPSPTLTSSPSATIKPSPRPSPRPIPHGKIGFTVGGGPSSGPVFGRGYLDPYDPQNGQKQLLGINISDTAPITSASITMFTDNKERAVSLNRVSGTDINGTWEGSWNVDDTYLYNYHMIIKAVSSKGTSSVDITLR